MACCGGSGGTPPPAPDYRGAAQEEFRNQLTLNRNQTAANRPTQITPWGSSTWTNRGGRVDERRYSAALDNYQRQAGIDPNNVRVNPDGSSTNMSLINEDGTPRQLPTGLRAPDVNEFLTPDDWAQETTLNPELQRQFDSEMSLGNTLLDQTREATNQPLDFSSLEDLPDSGFNAVEKVRDAMMSRLRPRLTEQRESDLARLRSIGIDEDDGMTYASGVRPINERENDAEQQALLGAAGEYQNIFSRALRGRQQGISEILTRRNQPLNELTALRRGGSVSMPSFPNFSQQGGTQAPDYTGVTDAESRYATDLYNAGEARRSGNQQSGVTVASAALLAL